MVNGWKLWLGAPIPELQDTQVNYATTDSDLYGITVLDPDWHYIQQALQRMNGRELNEISLDLEGTGSLMTGGGNDGYYVVVYFPKDHPDSPSLTLIDPSAQERDVVLTVQVPSEYPARMAVKLPVVLHVFKRFFNEGVLPTDMVWESDT